MIFLLLYIQIITLIYIIEKKIIFKLYIKFLSNSKIDFYILIWKNINFIKKIRFYNYIKDKKIKIIKKQFKLKLLFNIQIFLKFINFYF